MRPTHHAAVLLASLPALASLGACGHASTVGSQQGDQGQAPPASSARSQPSHATGGSGTGGEGAAGSAQGTQAGVVANPEARVKPGGEEKLVQALRKEGALRGSSQPSSAELSAAVRRFQEQKGLAATGYPDQKTLQALGLKEGDVERTRPH